MRKRLFGNLAAAALGLGIATLLAAPAAAQGPDQLRLSPATVAPGGSAQVTMSCEMPVDSPRATWAHGTVTLTTPGNEPVYHGTLSVPAKTPPGDYKVDSNCGHAFLTVSPRGAPRGGTGLDSDNQALLMAGAGSLTAAAGGLWLLRRRREADAPVG